MNMKPILKYQLHDYRKSLTVFYSILLGIILFFDVILYNVGSGSVSYSGTEMSAFVFVFVAGITFMKEPFRMFIQNGVSRKTVFTGQMASFVALAFIMCLLDVIVGLFGRLSEQFISLNYSGIVEILYSARYTVASEIQIGFESFLFSFCFYLAIAISGYFIALAYYRMNKGLKIAVSISVPALIFVALPIIDSLLKEPFLIRTIIGVITFAMGFFNGPNPYYAMVSALLVTAVFGGLSWLLMRKATAIA